MLEKMGPEYRIEETPGEDRKCLFSCPVAEKCSYFRERYIVPFKEGKK
jgi:hypothetical protein